MKTKLALAALIGMLISSTAIAQTNYKTVMVDTNGVLYRPTNFFSTNGFSTNTLLVNTNGTTASPTNFWSANSNNIVAVIPPVTTIYGGIDLLKTFARSKYVTSLTAIQTLMTNMNPSTGEGGWFTMYVSDTNPATIASGQARLMRNAWSSGSGAGIPFGQRNVMLVVDTQFTGGLQPTNIGRVVAGAGLGEWAAVPNSAAIGYEIRQATNGDTEVRIIAHNNTNLSTSGWVNIGGSSRQIIGIEARTNGVVNLWSASQSQTVSSGTLPFIRTNISGGPVSDTGGGEANLMAGIFVNTNTASGEAIEFYGAGIQLEE